MRWAAAGAAAGPRFVLPPLHLPVPLFAFSEPLRLAAPPRANIRWRAACVDAFDLSREGPRREEVTSRRNWGSLQARDCPQPEIRAAFGGFASLFGPKNINIPSFDHQYQTFGFGNELALTLFGLNEVLISKLGSSFKFNI